MTDEGEVTVKGGKGKNVSVKDTSGSFKILNEYPVAEDTLPSGWKYANTAKTSITATVASTAVLDLTESYGEGVITVDGSKATINAKIYGNSENNVIKGSKGNDTIGGGYGDDTVSLGGGADLYIYTGGNDLIQDYATVDTIQFETKINSAAVDGSNLIIVTNEGEVTVKGGKGKNVSVKDTSGSFKILDVYPTISGSYKEYDDKANTIENVDDDAIIDAKGGVDIITNKGNGVSINAGKGNDEITISRGAEYVTIYGGAGNDYIENKGSNILYQYADGDGKDTIYGYNEEDTLHIMSGTYSYEWKNNNLIVSVKGSSTGSITFEDVAGQEILIKDKNGSVVAIGNDSLPEGWKYEKNKQKLTATLESADELDLTKSYGDGVVTVDASKTGGAYIIGNENKNSIKGGKGENTLDGGEGNDILIGNNDFADLFVYNDGDDKIVNYTEGQDTIQVDVSNAKSKITFNTDDEDIIYYVEGAGEFTVQGGAGKKITLIDESGNKINLSTIPSGWTLDSKKPLLKASGKSPKENTVDLNDDYGDLIETVDGSAATIDVEIYGNDLKNVIKGGKGDDTLDGGDDNDKLTGGAGNDVFIYSGGNDTITDYGTGDDTIMIAIDDLSDISVETVGSSDLLYTTAEGTIKIQKGKGKDIVLVDENWKIINVGATIPDGWKFDSNKKLLQATVANAENEIDLNDAYGAEVEKVDASKITGGVEIVGNDLGNSIKGGKGADIITGGTGNDTVSLGGGEDIYIYTGGDDRITDYAAGDDTIRVEIDNTKNITSTVKGSDVIYTTDEGTITVVKGKGKDIVLVNSKNKTINVSSSKNISEEIWFMEDDNNFVSGGIDSICEQKFEVQNIQTQNNLELQQIEITFSEDK